MSAWAPPDDARYSPQARGEHLIAVGRVVLAAGSLLAIWLDPTEPAKYAALAYALLGGYVVYAAALAVVVVSGRVPLRPLQIVTHVVDLALFDVFMYLTEAPSSPFFVYVIFSVVCAAMRWQLRGALVTGAVSIVSFTALGVWAGSVMRDPLFELNRFLIRDVYLAVLTVLVGFLASLQERARREIAHLASWPRAGEPGTLLEDALRAAVELCGASRAVLVWEEGEEPWVNVASWSAGGLVETREPPGTFDPLVPAALGNADVARTGRTGRRLALVGDERGTLRPLDEECFHPELVARFGVGAALSSPVVGEGFAGRLFLLLDRDAVTSDDLRIGRIAAEMVSSRVQQQMSSRRLREAAADEARVRLAHDLHDGLLQSLTGASLQLRSLRGLAARDPASLPERLADVERIVVAEQRELRLFIEELRPGARDETQSPELAVRAREICELVARQWGVAVDLSVDGAGAVPPRQARELVRMLQESLFNAARHSGGRNLSARISADDVLARVVVEDDGHGFSFRGRYALADLERLQIGPVSLKARVSASGGALVVESRADGSRLEITLPIAGRRAGRGD